MHNSGDISASSTSVDVHAIGVDPDSLRGYLSIPTSESYRGVPGFGWLQVNELLPQRHEEKEVRLSSTDIRAIALLFNITTYREQDQQRFQSDCLFLVRDGKIQTGTELRKRAEYPAFQKELRYYVETKRNAFKEQFDTSK